MHAWTDGYEISEVNKSKTKKKDRKNRLSTEISEVNKSKTKKKKDTGAGARTLDHKLSLRET